MFCTENIVSNNLLSDLPGRFQMSTRSSSPSTLSAAASQKAINPITGEGEALNALNTVVFGAPDTTVTDIRANNPRIAQLSARFTFY
jgi:hypothetical protein